MDCASIIQRSLENRRLLEREICWCSVFLLYVSGQVRNLELQAKLTDGLPEEPCFGSRQASAENRVVSWREYKGRQGAIAKTQKGAQNSGRIDGHLFYTATIYQPSLRAASLPPFNTHKPSPPPCQNKRERDRRSSIQPLTRGNFVCSFRRSSW